MNSVDVGRMGFDVQRMPSRREWPAHHARTCHRWPIVQRIAGGAGQNGSTESARDFFKASGHHEPARHARPIDDVERIEAWSHGKANAMHGRDAYAIGRTLAGVQSPGYGPGRRNSLPDHTIVLHRDGAHRIV